ncbi:MAG: Ig-like domain-containing protein [Gemmatimonadota bacterium]
MRRRVWLLALAGAACARQGAIPGGPPDRIPPIVVETRPAPFAVVPDGWEDPVVIRFNERISERGGGGSLDDAVVVSPELEDVLVEHTRTGLEIRAPGGFPPGHVYRVTVRPAIQDLFGNSMRDPFELVFSTGPEPVPTVVAGTVTDRITGQPREVRVDAVDESGASVYPTRSDRNGIFALRYLPPGRYRLRAFEDRDRDAEIDFSEAQAQTTALLNSGADTVIYTLAVLEGDSTAARLTGIEVRDSATLALEFDDYLDPDLPLNTVRLRFTPAEGPIADTLPNMQRVLHPHQYEALLREQAAAADTLGDTVAARPLPPRVPVAPGVAQPPGAVPPDEPRPGQSIVVLLDRPLPVDVPLTVEVSGVVNIHRIPLGGGEETVVWEAPADTVVPPGDTLSVPDSLRPDTTGIARGRVGSASTPSLGSGRAARIPSTPPRTPRARVRVRSLPER